MFVLQEKKLSKNLGHRTWPLSAGIFLKRPISIKTHGLLFLSDSATPTFGWIFIIIFSFSIVRVTFLNSISIYFFIEIYFTVHFIVANASLKKRLYILKILPLVLNTIDIENHKQAIYEHEPHYLSICSEPLLLTHRIRALLTILPMIIG